MDDFFDALGTVAVWLFIIALLSIPWAIVAFIIYAFPIGAAFDYNDTAKVIAGVVAAGLVWVVVRDAA